MKQVFKIAPLAFAVAAFSTTALAETSKRPMPHEHEEGVTLSKKVSVEKDVHYTGAASISGNIIVDSLGMAVVEQNQSVDGNTSGMDRVDNTATLGDTALGNARGNIGVNITAGDNNVQSNAAALAAADESFAFGSADAEVFVNQSANALVTGFVGTMNTASISGDALSGARGNIGVNVSAGASNVQGNAFAASVASGSMGEASSSVNQASSGNMTTTIPEDYQEVITLRNRVSGTLSGGYSGGTTSGSYDTVSSTYDGQSFQDGPVYPEIWVGNILHNGPGTSPWGHIDFDDDNPAGGEFKFKDDGSITPDETTGDLRFTEAGTQDLSGTLTSVQQALITRYNRHQNSATLSDNALNNARGNIGVNVAAGAGNLQSNSLALTEISRANLPTNPQENP